MEEKLLRKYSEGNNNYSLQSNHGKLFAIGEKYLM